MSTWYIDPSHSAVTFRVKHMMISTVRGKFGKVRGSLEFDPQHPARAKVFAAMGARSIDTNDPKRDRHLASADFFDAEKHPEIVFRSTSVEPKGKNTYTVKGDLTIRGTTRPVSFDAGSPPTPDDLNRATLRRSARGAAHVLRRRPRWARRGAGTSPGCPPSRRTQTPVADSRGYMLRRAAA